MLTPLELLAPAGNADIGMAAIDHGADALYIGAPKFSARPSRSRYTLADGNGNVLTKTSFCYP